RGKTVAPEGNRPCARGLQIVTHLARWWRRFRTKAARLFQKDFKIGATSRLPKSFERADQGRRRFSNRQICRAGAEDEVVCGVVEQTNARKVLLISDAFDQTTLKSGRNVKPVTLATASDVNTEQLLASEKILVTHKALEKLAVRTRPPRSGEPTE